MGNFSGRTSLYTGKVCVGVSQYRSSTKGRLASETWHAVGRLKAFTYTHSGTAGKENYDPEIVLPTLDLNSQLHLGGGPPHGPWGKQK